MRDFINVQLLYYFDLFYIRTRRKLLLVLDFRLSEIYENQGFQEIEQGRRGTGSSGGIAIKKRARSTITPLSRSPNSCLLIVSRHPSR